MTTTTQRVTAEGIKKAIEGRDGRMLASFYNDDAIVRRFAPPSPARGEGEIS